MIIEILLLPSSGLGTILKSFYKGSKDHHPHFTVSPYGDTEAWDDGVTFHSQPAKLPTAPEPQASLKSVSILHHSAGPTQLLNSEMGWLFWHYIHTMKYQYCLNCRCVSPPSVYELLSQQSQASKTRANPSLFFRMFNQELEVNNIKLQLTKRVLKKNKQTNKPRNF